MRACVRSRARFRKLAGPVYCREGCRVAVARHHTSTPRHRASRSSDRRPLQRILMSDIVISEQANGQRAAVFISSPANSPSVTPINILECKHESSENLAETWPLIFCSFVNFVCVHVEIRNPWLIWLIVFLQSIEGSKYRLRSEYESQRRLAF